MGRDDPPGPFIPAEHQLLSYQIPYNTDNVDDSPSYALDSLYPAAYNDILPALARGWFVNIPDFEGPLAAFTVSVEEAHATLDSVRASLACRKGLNQSNTRSALWGYSGGSLPSELAAEMHPLYAPEITLSGTAIGGLLPNIIHALETVTGHYYAGLAPLALLGLASRYPEVADYLDRALKSSGPYNRSTFLATKTQTTNEVFPTFENQTIADYFVHGEAYLRAPELKAAVHRNWLMGAYSTPTTPLFVYKAVHDEISPVADTDALVDRYCAAGANILYQRNTVGGHTAEDVNGDAAAFA